MFESITRRMSGILSSITRRKLTEKNVRETLQEIRVALLEADVALEVVKDFLARVEAEALGERVLQGVDPGQQFIYLVYEEMAKLMGPVDTHIHFQKGVPTVILMAGLQGSGKTTTCGKLALLLKQDLKRRPLLVAADIQRPAAVEQLKTLGGQINVPVFAESGVAPPQICAHAVEAAPRLGCDTVILDTAGRLHIDEEMMREVSEVARLTQPHDIFLVCDSMMGQDAVRSAREFNDKLELTGVILTKLDGDARGGAALSVKAVTGKPIKFIGDGERLDGSLKPFRPEGMAQRILGFGDVVQLVQDARKVVDEKEAAELQDRLLAGTFTLDHFLDQLQAVKKMGSLGDLLKLVPGIGAHVDQMGVDDKELLRIEAIIRSMTPKERQRPEILNTMRRDRIARGAGVERPEVDDLLKQFQAMRKMMDGLSRVGGKGPFGKIKALAKAKRQMADLGGMMAQMAEAVEPANGRGRGQRPRPGGPPGPRRQVSKEELKRRRKRERQNRRRGRRK
jgi:signal recognition particle subunit SRP54